jgi:hypothetical protein
LAELARSTASGLAVAGAVRAQSSSKVVFISHPAEITRVNEQAAGGVK